MPSRSKVRLDAIERIKHALQSLPEHHDDEVTKTQAIRMLIPDIQAIRAKGYSLPAIIELLSEHGVAVTVPSLKTILSPSRREGDGKKRRRAKRKPSRPDAQSEGLPEEASKPREKASTAAPDTKPGGSMAGGVASSAVAGSEVPVATAKAPPVRRAMFVPRPDSEEI